MRMLFTLDMTRDSAQAGTLQVWHFAWYVTLVYSTLIVSKCNELISR